MGHLRDPVGLVLVGSVRPTGAAVVVDSRSVRSWAMRRTTRRARGVGRAVIFWAVAMIENGYAEVRDRGSDVA